MQIKIPVDISPARLGGMFAAMDRAERTQFLNGCYDAMYKGGVDPVEALSSLSASDGMTEGGHAIMHALGLSETNRPATRNQ